MRRGMPVRISRDPAPKGGGCFAVAPFEGRGIHGCRQPTGSPCPFGSAWSVEHWASAPPEKRVVKRMVFLRTRRHCCDGRPSTHSSAPVPRGANPRDGVSAREPPRASRVHVAVDDSFEVEAVFVLSPVKRAPCSWQGLGVAIASVGTPRGHGLHPGTPRRVPGEQLTSGCSPSNLSGPAPPTNHRAEPASPVPPATPCRLRPGLASGRTPPSASRSPARSRQSAAPA
jgi:hypothetical protein